MAGARLIDPSGGDAQMPPTELSVRSFAPIVITILIVCLSIIRARATRPLARTLFRLELTPFRGLQFLHSGVVGDYVAWMMIGVAALAAFLGR